MASVLIAYSVGLAGLGFVVKSIAPRFGQVTFIAALAGGALCLLWGVAALAGMKGRAWATLSAIPITVVLLTQVVQAWFASTNAAPTSLAGRLVLTLMLLGTIGMLMYLLHGERPPEFYQTGTTHRANPISEKNEGHSRDERSRR